LTIGLLWFITTGVPFQWRKDTLLAKNSGVFPEHPKQGPKLCFLGRQCNKKFCTGNQNFTAGCHWAINYAISHHDNYTNGSK